MSNITEYQIVSEHQLEIVVSKVNALISEGWQPLGGLQVVAPVINDSPAPLFSQAMVKTQNPGKAGTWGSKQPGIY